MSKNKVKYIIIRTIILTGIIFGFSSCQKELMTPMTGDNTAVVEAYLVAGEDSGFVYISKVLPFSDDTVCVKEMISGLKVYINDELLTEVDSGVYRFETGSEGFEVGSTYDLTFEYGGNTVTSSTIIPVKPTGFTSSASTVYATRITEDDSTYMPGPGSMMDEVELTWDNDDLAYHYLMVEYLEDSADYINANLADTEFPFNQATSPTQETYFKIGMQNLRYFGSYRIVLLRVNTEFNDAFTENGSNSNNLVNPNTNITNGFGLFTGVSSDTVYLEVVPK
jgi:hypothetical protein